MRKIVIGILSLFLAFNGLAQTPGLIYKPANAGQSVLDPNLDGYISKTNQGFQGDDETDSEIAYVPLPVVGTGEPNGDNSAGPSCGFVDMVRSDDDETIYTYSDATNLHFRFRLGGTAENSKGYTILVDADQKFGATGPDADPDYTPGNPGFEYEITLRTNFGVSIYNIDNNTLTSTEIGDGTVDRPYTDFAQKAVAGSTICGTDYFYDFYVPYADLPYTSATPVRMVGGTTIAPKNSTGFKMADLGGVDDDEGITDDLFQELIDVFPPTSGDDVSAGGTIDPRAECPGITGPIAVDATSVSGTTSEVDGATIELFRDGVSQGTTLASGGTWTLSGISAAVANEVFTATAKVGETAATATGTEKKSTSYSTCNASTVGAFCANSPHTLSITGNSSGVNFSLTDAPNTTYTIILYDAATDALIAGSKWAANENPIDVTTDATGNFTGVVDANQGSAIPNGVYYLTSQITSGGCESDRAYICDGATASTTPTIAPATITPATSTLTSTATSGTTLLLFINDISVSATITEPSSGSFSITGFPTLSVNDIVKVSSRESGNCPAESSTITVTAETVQSAAPIITEEFCIDAAGSVTSVSGISSEDINSIITIYTGGTGSESSTGQTGLVQANGSWTVTGLSIGTTSEISATATASGGLESDFSSKVTVKTKTPDPTSQLKITSNPVTEGDASISGEALASTSDNLTIQLYIDGVAIDGATAVLPSDALAGLGTWTITGLDTPFDKLFADGVATVTISNPNPTFCESDPSAGVVIQCKPPDNSMNFAATSATTICAGETIDFSVSTTEDLIVYELVDQASNGVGPAALGDGNPLSLTTYAIDASVTSISLIAKRIGISCDETVGTIPVSPEQINLTQVSTDPSGCATPDGTITLSGLTASESYTLDYTLDGVAATSSTISADGSGDYVISSLGAGNYTDITISGTAVTLICDNVIAGPVVLSVPGAPVLTLGVETGPSTCTGTDGSITFNSDELSTNYTLNYLLDGVADSRAVSSDGTGTIAGFTGLSAGVYSSVSITNTISGCKSNILGPFTLVDPDPTIFIAGSANPSACGGNGTINLGFTGFADGTYTINYDGGSFSGVVVTSNAATISAPAGSYVNLSATESATNCLTNEDPDVTLLDPATHTIAATRTNPTSCGGNGSINLTFTGVPDATNYTVNYDGGSFTNVEVSSNVATISTPAGTYSNLSLTLSGCVSAEYPDVTLTDPANPIISLTSSSDPTTVGGTDGQIVLGINVPDGTYTLNYQDDTPSAQTFTGVTVSSGSASISGLTEGTYNDITITNSNSCTSAENIDVVLTDPVAPGPDLTGLATSATDVCAGTASTVSVSATSLPDGAYTVNYTLTTTNAQGAKDVAMTISGGTNSGTFSTPSLVSAGTTNVTINSITLSGNTTAAASGNTDAITVTARPTVTFSAEPGASACVQTDVTYTTQGGQSNYVWTFPGTVTTDYTITSGGGTTDNTVTLRYVTTGSKTVTVNYENGAGCPATSATSSAATTVDPASVGGSIAGSATVCTGTNSTTLTLSGHTGLVTKWQSSTSSDFSTALTDIANTTTSLTATNLTATTYYRAVVQSGVCATANSATGTVTVDPASVGGSIAGSATVCTGTNSTTLTLSGHTGSVTKWQSSTSSDFSTALTDIANTTTSLTATNLTATTYYRAVVQSGVCATANSATGTVTVDPASVGGSIAGSATVCTGTNSTTLTLSGETGSVTKWQSSTSSDFSTSLTDIANTTTSLTATNLTATTYYRAVVQSGVCATANSATGTVTVNANPSVTLAASPTVSQGTTSADLGYTAFNGPDQYTIDYDATAEGQGFVDVSTTSLPASPISLVVPGAASAQTYNATITVINSTSGCSSSATPFTITVSSVPVEVCNNGIDDDGDGLIDCYDSDCHGLGDCEDFFYGQNTPTCLNPPAVLPEFTLEEIFRSDNVNSGFDQRSGVMVGDMDGDGIAEIVTHDRTDDEILIFNGLNGEIKQTISQNGGGHQFAMVALGDVDSDGLGDILVTEGSNSNAVIRRYEYSASGNQSGTGNAIFTTAQLVGTRVNYSSPQLADFDEDGSPEVYVGANIFNAETGALVAQDNTINSGWLNSGTNQGDRLPIAYNIFDSGDTRPAGAGGGTFGSEADGLEFVAGNRVYTVDGGAFQLAAEITGSNYGDGFVSLGDLDNDNEVDIIVTSEGYIFAWNPRTETGIGNIYNIPGTSSGGKANVGDFDNDGIVDIGFAGSNRYIVLEYNSGANTLSVKWEKTGLDDGSQRTGSTLYDFEGDGIAEVVYSEEAYLYIYSGLDGAELTRIPSLAGTRVEYPLVADVNNDGQAEIIVTAQEGNGPGFSGADDYFVVYKSANSSWVSSREIWNQHGYHVTNINDDMTIPQYQQDIFHPQFGGSLNGFLVQTTYLDQGGEPTYATSDLVVTASSVDQNCASSNNGLDISMTIQNQGDWKAPRTTPITIYDADPYAGAANVIDTVHLPVTLEVGASRVLNTTVQDDGQDFTLFVLVNHNPYEAGTTTEIATPLAAGTTNTWVNECDYTNNSFSESIINCNEEPVITDVDVSVNEDNTYTFAATDFSGQYTDAEGEPIDRIQITSLPSASAGILYLSGVAIAANDEIDFADLANITFVPVADFDGDATFNWNAHDGTEYALAGAAVNIDIIPVNDAPLLTLDADNSEGGADNNGFDVSYTEDDGVVSILDAADAAVSDIDDTQMASLIITVGGLQDGDNEEVIINGVTFTLGSNNTQTTTIGGTTFQIAYVSGVFTITNNAGGDFDIADINSLLATIQYQHNDGDSPTDGDRTLTFVTNDGDDDSAAVVSTISVASTNDAPVAVDDPSNELVEDGNITVSTVGANDTDVDGTIDASTIILIDPSNPSNTGNRLSDLIIAGVGTYAVDISGNVTFTPESGFTGDASVNYTIDDNEGTTSNSAEIGITVITKPDITLGANPTVCEGATTASLSYSATAGGANQYSIDYADAAFTDVVNATLSASPISLAIPGGTSEEVYTATLTVSNSSNGYVSTSKSISITINDTPSIGATPSDPTTCSGSDGSIAISGVKNATAYSVSYTFNASVVNTSITSGGAGNSLTITGLVEGTYTNISVTASGCPSNTIASVTLSDPTAATIALGTTSNPTSCNGTDGAIQLTGLTASTNYSLSYDKNASTVSTTISSDGSGNYSLSGLTSGTYENFVVTTSGCTSNTIAGPVTLSDPNSPTITYDSDQDPASCSSTDGFIVLSSLTSGRDYQYSYTKNSSVTTGTLTADGAGKITINNLPAGTYTSVFVDDVITGCQSNVIPSLVLNPPDIQLGTVTNATTCSGTDGSIAITSLAANTAYDLDYSIDGTPVATASITADASGVYNITSLGEGAYTNIRFTNNGCVTNSLSTTITEPTPATIAQGTVSNPSKCAGADGSIQITGLSVSASYWVNYSDDGTPVAVTIGSDGSGNLTITGLDDGTYTNISVTKDNCTSNAITSIVLSDPDNPTMTLGSNPEVCAGTASTSITYSATTGSPDQYSINFDAAANTAGFVDVSDVALPAGSIPITVGTSTAGTYSAVITIKNSSISCTTDYNISVTVNPNPTITLGTSPEVCQGEISANLPYSAVSGSPDEYEIDFDATAEAQGFVDVSNITLGASPIAITVPAGANAAAYNATLKVINTTTGCESTNTSFTITVNEKPTITLGTNPEVCEGETSASLSYTAVSGGDQYSISFDATALGQGFADVAATALPSSPIAVTLPGGAAVATYNGTINAINSTTGCVSDSKPFTIKVNSTPDITPGTSPAVCMGETSATLGYSALSGGADQYSIDFDATAEGEGFVDISNAALPSSPISLTIPAAASMDVYNANLIVTNSSTGCVSSTKAITITVNDNPIFTLGTNPEVCRGVTSGSLPYTVSAGNPDQYSIDFDASAESQGFADVSNAALGASPLSVTIPAAAVANSYNATITLTNSSTGCVSSSAAFTVTVNTIPTISLGSDPEYCEGETTGGISYSATTGSPDLYSIDFADASFTDIANQAITATPLAFAIPGATTDGTYAATLTVSNATTGCVSAVNNFNVIVKNTPAITSASTNPTTCNGVDGSITLSGLNDAVTYTVSYNRGGSPVTTSATPSSGDIVLIGLSEGAYANIKVSEDGCDSNEIALITLSDPATATVAIDSQNNPTTCGGSDGSIVISTGIASAVSYTVQYSFNSTPVSTTLSSDGAGDITIGSLAAGQYEKFKVTANGCESNELAGPINLFDPTAPTISFTDGNNSQPSTCAATDGVIAIFGVVDNTSYDYDYTYGGSAVNGTVTSETSGNELRITGLNAGTYTDVSVTISGCQSNTLESIVLNPPDISIGTTVDPTTCSGTDGSIQIVGFAANTGYNINYDLDGTAVAEFGITSDGSGEFIITNLGAGAYTNITAENSGCTTSPVLSATLSDPAIPTIAEGTHSNPTTCSGTDGLIQLTGLNASTAYAVSYTVGGSTISNTLSSNASGVIEITGLGAGNYTNVTATLTNCESNALSITLTDPASPGFSLGNTSQEVCEGTLTSTTTYTITSGSADTYSIDFDGTATIEGFVDVNDAALSGGNITINIPAGADTRSYSAFVTVKNTTTNCESATVPVSLYINYEPTITLNAIPDICVGATEALITYADTLAGTDDYNIVWDAAALADGFANVTGGRLFSANPISVTVPGTASATTYNGVFTVENSTSGCVSQDYTISLTINENPSLTLGTNPEVCFGETSTSISYSGATGSPDQYMIDYDATAEGQGFVDVAISGLPSSPISLVVPAAAIPGTYNADLVVTNSGTSCNSSALPFTVTVNAYPTTPTVTAQTTGDTTPEISGSADNGSNITVIVGGATYTTVATATGWTIDTGADTPVSGTFAPNTNGVNEVQVTSESNNCSISDASTDELTIDTTDPIVPTVESQVTNDVNPTIVGTAEPGSQITVVVGGATFIVTTDAGGNWTVDTNNAPNAGAFAPNVNGANEVQVTSEDAAGNTSVDATTLELVIDTTDPADPTIAAQTTNDPTPVITGTAEAGSTVTVVVSGATYTVTADGSGNWSVDTEVVTPDSGAFAPDVNGSNEVAVTSTDEAGNSSTDTTTLELIIDTTDPVTPTVVPQITNDTTPEITGTAEANSTVTVVVGGASYTVTADGSGDWSVDTGVLTPVAGTFSPNVNGTNEVSVTSTDAAGNSSTDVTNLELTIDTTDPATPTVASQTTNDTTPVISGTAEAGSTVTVVVSGATYTVTADGSGNWSIDTEVVIPDSGAFALDVNGSNEVAVTSTDTAGNSTSDTSTLELIIDTTDPAVPTVVSQTTNDTTPSLTGTAEVGSTVTIVVAGATYTTTADASGNWVINTETDTPSMGVFNPNVNGTNEVSVTSTDAAGNSSVDATTLELTIDTTPPTISVNAISVDDKINAIEDDSDITITGTSSGADGQTATIVLNGVTYNPVIAAGSNWSITLTAAQAQALPEGDNTLTADVDDAAGNSATQATRTVDHDTTLPATPTVDALLSNSTTPTITGTTGTGAALAAGETMEVTVNGATYTVTPDASGNWSVDTGSDTPSSGTLGTFSDGNTYQVVATVTDDAGNTSTDTSTDELTIDTTPPTISVNAISVDDKINAIEDNSDITITGTSSGADGQTATIVLNGVTYNPVIAAGGNWSITLTAAQAQALPEGDNTLTADVDDAAGNSATQASRDIEHDSVAPTLAINVVSTDDIISALEDDSPVTISGTTDAEDGQTVTVVLNGETYTATVSGGTWSLDIPAVDAQGLPEGMSTITANVSDVAG
ncbi:MAG: Ig-like domain-containing protein, partial [Cyclobacteriaceae bacterium]